MSISLYKDFRVIGSWWLPESPDIRVPGELSYEWQGDIRLRLLGDPSGGTDSSFVEASEHTSRLIFGISEDGKPVTVSECISVGARGLGPEYVSIDFQAREVFLGLHIREPSTHKFSAFAIVPWNLKEWMSWQPIRTSLEAADDSEFHVRVARYHPGSPLELRLSKPSETTLIFGTTFRSSYGIHKLTWETDAWVQIQPTTPMFLREVKDWIRDFELFLGLLMGYAVNSLEVGLSALGSDQAVSYIFDSRRHGLRGPVLRMPFTLPLLQERLTQLLDAWFSLREELSPVLDLFQTLTYNRALEVEFQFLAVMQALETYVTRRKPRTIVDTSVFQEIIKHLKNSIPEDTPSPLREKLDSTFEYANEPSLRQKLRTLLSDMDPQFMAAVLKPYRDNHFVQLAVDERNYRTHYSQDKEGNSPPLLKLYEIKERLHVLLYSLLLRELGLGWDEIMSGLRRSQAYWRYVETTNEQ